MGALSVKEIIEICGEMKCIGNKNSIVTGLNLCNRNTEEDSILSYAVNEKYEESVKKLKAVKILLVEPKHAVCYEKIVAERSGCLLLSSKPEECFYKVHEALCKRHNFYEPYDFPPQIGTGSNIHKSAVLYDGVKLGNNVTIGALSVVRPGTVIEDNVTIGCNSVIGSEGFQIIEIPGKEPLHISHIGGTHIYENVNIGDCVCIARSLFAGDTHIEKGVKIDNLVYVGHNSYIGENAVITSHVTLCGSAVIHNNAWIAPHASILNRVTVGEYARVGLGSVVTRDVSPHSLVYGVPAKEAARTIKE